MSFHQRLCHEWLQQICALIPGQRVTRVRVLALLALGIAQAMAVTPQRAALELAGPRRRAASLERRFWRWLANPGVDAAAMWDAIAPELAAPWAGPEPLLVFDPTPIGTRFSALVVSLVVGNRALPLAWVVVPQQVRWPSRMAPLLARLLRRTLAVLPDGCRPTVLLDRGLAGPAVVDAVRDAGCDVVLRLRSGPNEALRVRTADGREWRVPELVAGPGQRWSAPVRIFKQAKWREGWLTVWWGEGHREPLVLFSSREGGYARVREYKRRAGVEATYADLKTRGLGLESSRLRQAARLERLLVAVVLALWWLSLLGRRLIQDGQRKLAEPKHRRLLSVLRLGKWSLDQHLLADRMPPLPGGRRRPPALASAGGQSVR